MSTFVGTVRTLLMYNAIECFINSSLVFLAQHCFNYSRGLWVIVCQTLPP